ncbi:hypothetical protein BD626DRAFT_500458 [Schizophyllum amplum]|uniref:Cytochrome b mRNA-processing protein 4 n=1 Tax=Schizophyllum amplum TaxID=97359 RepID=A0A550CAD8_9AGAR|nr:hypothetical protein BD626DRAFT_500458 [Auriculariopsis ampla]
MSSTLPFIAKVSVYCAGAAAFGWALMKVTVPSPDQVYKEMAPDLQRAVDMRRQMAHGQAPLAAQARAQAHMTPSDDPDNVKPVWSDRR